MNSQKNFVSPPTSKNIFDKAFVFSIALVFIVGGIWATERVLIYLADKQITEYQATTAASLSSISAEDVQVVHDVTSRLTTIQKQGSGAFNTNEVLTALERSTIPQVKLTEYEYSSSGSVMMKGVVADYRLLAEQIFRYRQEEIFATAEVIGTDRNEDGQVIFDMKVVPAETSTTPSP